jgi:hypothetical protein
MRIKSSEHYCGAAKSAKQPLCVLCASAVNPSDRKHTLGATNLSSFEIIFRILEKISVVKPIVRNFIVRNSPSAPLLQPPGVLS